MIKPVAEFIDKIEENLIIWIMFLMLAITFANVVARSFFNSNMLWALESTVFLFGWLVLLGASYAVKHKLHLGVDIITNLLSPFWRRYFALFSVTMCIIFSFLLVKGAWDYWANFANLPASTGRWFPTGLQDKFLSKGWYEVNDIPMPQWLSFLKDIFNDGEPYEKIPRLIPYIVLPISMALLLLRFCQLAWQIWQGSKSSLIASHEEEVGDFDIGAKGAQK
ncbi:MAG: TRAP transporter small permease [Proteobacteria bacterium]|nr:TRAP transporter small permease [Pseudomonadota bacterium]